MAGSGEIEKTVEKLRPNACLILPPACALVLNSGKVVLVISQLPQGNHPEQH